MRKISQCSNKGKGQEAIHLHSYQPSLHKCPFLPICYGFKSILLKLETQKTCVSQETLCLDGISKNLMTRNNVLSVKVFQVWCPWNPIRENFCEIPLLRDEKYILPYFIIPEPTIYEQIVYVGIISWYLNMTMWKLIDFKYSGKFLPFYGWYEMCALIDLALFTTNL